MESLLQRIVLVKRLYRILTAYVNNAQFFFEMNSIQGKIATCKNGFDHFFFLCFHIISSKHFPKILIINLPHKMGFCG